MINQENISEIRKSTGRVYQILTETMERYWDKRSLMFFTNLCDDLKAAGTEAYKELPSFPIYFYPNMVDALLRWHWDRFSGINDIEIKPTFQMLWKFHRAYLGLPQTDEMWDKALAESNTLMNGQDEHLKPFIISILKDLERRNSKE